jgi:hypothetical protein
MRQEIQVLAKTHVLQRQLLNRGTNAQISSQTVGTVAGGKEGEVAVGDSSHLQRRRRFASPHLALSHYRGQVAILFRWTPSRILEASFAASGVGLHIVPSETRPT